MKIYLDNAATTQIDPEVLTVITETLQQVYANPSSAHTMGQAAAAIVEEARENIARTIGAHPSEIIFTPSGTYANNLALLGYARANKKKGNHIISSCIEHYSVLEACAQLEREGFDVTYLPVDTDGIVNIRQAKEAIRDDTILMSVMHVNNEIGTIQPIKELGEIARKKKICFHTDAVQSFGKMSIDADRFNLDMFSISAHKLHGSKGIGVLYVRKGTKLQRILFGGNQERKLVPGTINAPLIAGFSKAVDLISDKTKLEQNAEKIRQLRDHLIELINQQLPQASINGSLEYRCSENINMFFPQVETDAFLYALDQEGLCISAGSACTAGSIKTSHVIKAIGKDQGGASIRITLSRNTTSDEMIRAAELISRTYQRLVKK